MIPSLPMPREKYVTEASPIENRPGTWNSLHLDVYDKQELLDGRAASRTVEPVASYDRNYHTLYRTFEPFRQNGHDYALISRFYTGTSVLDLESGEIVAEEPRDGGGFCPAGFYVPDWWDIHDGSVQPGDEFWDEDYLWPDGTTGFVWGCHWGDDTSWKVQHLDLSGISEGKLVREERWGYLELATFGDPWDFIRVDEDCRGKDPKNRRVSFSVVQRHDLAGIGESR